MAQKFLTLEGCRMTGKNLFGSLCGLGAPKPWYTGPDPSHPMKLYRRGYELTDTRSADDIDELIDAGVLPDIDNRLDARGAPIPAASPTATTAPSAQEKQMDAMYKPSGYDITEKTPSLFASYGLKGYDEEMVGEVAYLALAASGFDYSDPVTHEDLLSLGGLTLQGFSFKRAFTPPRAVRQAVRKVVPPKMTQFLRKAIRYTGAMATSLPGVGVLMPGSIRNKIFGLKGGEIKTFDAALKISKAITIATVAVVGAPAIGGMMSGPASSGFSNFMATGVGKSFLGKQIAGKVGSYLMKDAIKGQIIKLVKDKAGNMIGEIFSKKQIPEAEYNALPDNQPIPITTEPGEMSIPATVAGTSGMAPGGDRFPGQPFGEVASYSQKEVDSSVGEVARTRLDPDEDKTAFLPPTQSERLKNVLDEGEEPLLSQQIAQGRKIESSDFTPADTIDGEPSLGSIAREIRRRRRSSRRF